MFIMNPYLLAIQIAKDCSKKNTNQLRHLTDKHICHTRERGASSEQTSVCVVTHALGHFLSWRVHSAWFVTGRCVIEKQSQAMSSG